LIHEASGFVAFALTARGYLRKTQIVDRFIGHPLEIGGWAITFEESKNLGAERLPNDASVAIRMALESGNGIFPGSLGNMERMKQFPVDRDVPRRAARLAG